MGTTHADYFQGDPVTRADAADEVETRLRANTGAVIVEAFTAHRPRPRRVPAVLVANHGPFTWGRGSASSHRARGGAGVRRPARVAGRTARARRAAPGRLLSKASPRKHGPEAYYGQNESDAHGACLWDLDGTLVDSEAFTGHPGATRSRPKGEHHLRRNSCELRAAERSDPAGLARRGRVAGAIASIADAKEAEYPPAGRRRTG